MMHNRDGIHMVQAHAAGGRLDGASCGSDGHPKVWLSSFALSRGGNEGDSATATLIKTLTAVATGTVLATSAFAQAANEVPRSTAANGTATTIVTPLAEAQPPPRVLVDAPLAEPLARGVVVLQYRAENLRIVPVFGAAAVEVSPRVGHLHVTIDDMPWDWADASGVPIIIQNLPPGPHRVLVELANANHHILDHRLVEFVVPNVGQRPHPTPQAGSR